MSYLRTNSFHIDPSGRMLVAEHNRPVKVRDGDQIKTVMAGLSVLRIGDDGKQAPANRQWLPPA